MNDKVWTAAELPKLPPMPKAAKDGSNREETNPAELDALKEVCNRSAVPVVNEDGTTSARCANCGQLTPWWETMWGRWNSGLQVMIVVRPSPGQRKWKRFTMPAMVAGRVCKLKCALKLPDFKMSKEPEVTMGRQKWTPPTTGEDLAPIAEAHKVERTSLKRKAGTWLD